MVLRRSIHASVLDAKNGGGYRQGQLSRPNEHNTKADP